MKICIAQIRPIKGAILENMNNHLSFVRDAIAMKSDLVVFPELSISGYEPILAKELACNKVDQRFNPFQTLADQHEITIGIGVPTKSAEGIHISMLIFQPNQERLVYSKQLLHEDELPYFMPGKEQRYLHIKGKKIALGICFESLQKAHLAKAHQDGADIYMASVAKPQRGIDKADAHFPFMAKSYALPILMVNSIGFCDNFVSAGQSAVWNNKGEILVRLDAQNEGLISYDCATENTHLIQFKIALGSLNELDKLFQIYQNGKLALEEKGIFQWTSNYPTVSIIEEDLKKGFLYTLKINEAIVGAINISEEQEAEYRNIDWKFNASKILVVHRLVIDPKHQRKGYASRLMDFAENFAREHDYTSIRLDAYSQNPGVLKFYKERKYVISGNVHFPEREHAFHCMEKEIKN